MEDELYTSSPLLLDEGHSAFPFLKETFEKLFVGLTQDNVSLSMLSAVAAAKFEGEFTAI